MMLKIQWLTRCAVFTAAAACLAASQAGFAAANNPSSPGETPQALIRLLESDAPPQDKAITCKKLAIYGGKEAVPALAALLPDPELASWARIALEAIPDPAADDALRAALGQLQGRLLIGVINSIGVRRDAKAVPELSQRLNDADAGVAVAAAESLGRIGGSQATQALEKSLAAAPEEVRGAVAGACVRCAAKLFHEGNLAEAVRLYDKVRGAAVPKQRVLEATRGAILARQTAGIPLLLEQLRSEDKGRARIGLRTARELPGREVTEALAVELDRSSGDRQVLLVLALADRRDAAVLPKLLQVAQVGPKPVRITALGLLDRFGDLSSLPVLLHAATEGDADLARTAKATLARLHGKQVDAEFLARLPAATGSMRQVLIELAAHRRIEGAVPAIMQSTGDSDAAVRHAALESIAVLGTDRQAGDLVRLLSQARTPQERDEVGKALLAVCGRSGAPCLPSVLPLARNAESDLRRIGLRALASIGGPEALAVVVTALKDRDEAVRDEAVSTLSSWPNAWPEEAGVAEPLLALAKSGEKTSYRVQGARGYLQYVREETKLTPEEKLAKVKALLPLLQRPEEKRLAIAAMSTFPSAGVVELLIGFAQDPALAEEACLDLVKIVTGNSLKDGSKELRRKALATVVERSQNGSTRRKAEEGLKRLN